MEASMYVEDVYTTSGALLVLLERPATTNANFSAVAVLCSCNRENLSCPFCQAVFLLDADP